MLKHQLLHPKISEILGRAGHHATLDHVLTVQTADQQRYANILLSIGVRMG